MWSTKLHKTTSWHGQHANARQCIVCKLTNKVVIDNGHKSAKWQIMSGWSLPVAVALSLTKEITLFYPRNVVYNYLSSAHSLFSQLFSVFFPPTNVDTNTVFVNPWKSVNLYSIIQRPRFLFHFQLWCLLRNNNLQYCLQRSLLLTSVPASSGKSQGQSTVKSPWGVLWTFVCFPASPLTVPSV